MDDEIKRAHEQLYFFVSQTSKKEQKNYYSKLHLSPLKVGLVTDQLKKNKKKPLVTSNNDSRVL